MEAARTRQGRRGRETVGTEIAGVVAVPCVYSNGEGSGSVGGDCREDGGKGLQKIYREMRQ